MNRYLLIALLCLTACAQAPALVVARPVLVADDSVWLSRSVAPIRTIVVGDDEQMTVTAFDAVLANGLMKAQVQRGVNGTSIRHHAVGEVVTVLR